MPNIVIPYFSKSGHTKRLAEAVLAGVGQLTSDARLIDIMRMSDEDWLDLEAADGIVFGSPTFMGSVAGQYKLFLDEAAYRGFWTDKKFLNKMAAGFTVATYPSGDKLNTIMQLAIYAAQYGMIWVGVDSLGAKVSGIMEDCNDCGSWLGLMATSIPNKTKLIGESDLAFAEAFGVRFTQAVERWTG